MRVYLIQHGLAKDESEDVSRPLSDQGREDITRTAGFLSLFEKPKPTTVLHSGKLRAKQTAEMFAQAWGGMIVKEYADLLPNADANMCYEQLNAMQNDVAVVGHLPHLSKLASLLICEDVEHEVVTFRNAGVLCLESQGDRGWCICWQLNPTLFYGES